MPWNLTISLLMSFLMPISKIMFYNDVLLKDGVEAAEDQRDVHHELADVLALIPLSAGRS